MPDYGSCNLGSLDFSKFYNKELDDIDYTLFEKAIRLGVNFLDMVIDANSFPSERFKEVALKSRPIGLGYMGLADLFLMKKIAYGSKESIEYTDKILGFMYSIANDESIKLGVEKGVPEWCQKLNVPRRNITILTCPPTGTTSLIAGCSSGCEPIFSEITIRNDKTGTYTFENDLSSQSYFRCAVSADEKIEVTWEEHVNIQAISQKWIDSAVSKTVNVPNHTHKETIAKIYMYAWKSGCKGTTIYRDKSKKMQVLSPKNIKKDKCPVCGEENEKVENFIKCSKCDWKIEKESE